MHKSFLFLCACVTLLYLPDGLNSARSCFYAEGTYCNPEYLCPCCDKLYFEDGTDKGLTDNYGLFCNMQDAVIAPMRDDPYPSGCCQRCTTEGDGCTEDIRPCCPDHNPVPDPECGEGKTKCERKNMTLLYKNAEYAYRECNGKLPSCYGEGKFCKPPLWPCCKGLTCSEIGSWGVCKRDGSGKVGTQPPPVLTFPLAPLDPTCPTWKPTTTTPEPTTPKPTTPAPDGEDKTSSLLCGKGKSYKIKGGYCDGMECCPGLVCPKNWLVLQIVRGILNRFGIWRRVCRDYPPFQWYNLFTWIHY